MVTVTPNKQQQKAIQWRGGHLLVLAGAGTGKTSTVVERASGLLADGIPANKIIMLTFTRRAAKEMAFRIKGRSERMFAGTFHSWALMIMRSRLGFSVNPDNWTIIDRDDQLQIIRRIKARKVSKEESKEAPKPAQMLAYIGYARSTVADMGKYLSRHTNLSDSHIAMVASIADSYRDYKLSRRYMDYDDILEKVADDLHASPALAKRVGERYVEVMIDEGQDLNPLQWKIIDALTPHARIFMVGDDGQSIYAFRGADFESIHSFKKRIPRANVIKLEENYRSGQGILDLSNWVLAQSPLEYQKKLVGTRGRGNKPVFYKFKDCFDEARWIAAKVIRAQKEGGSFSDNKVLVRAMSAGKNIEAVFAEKGIPYTVIGGKGLFTLSHTKDLLAAVRAAANIKDELAWFRYLMMFPGVGAVTTEKIVKGVLDGDTMDDVKHVIEDALGSKAPPVIKPLAGIDQNRRKPGKALVCAMRDLKNVFKSHYDSDWAKRLPDISLMVKLAARRKSITDFIETYTIDPVNGTQLEGPEQEKVTIITVHSAKGLEGKRIFIPQAQHGMYPFKMSLGSPEQIEEERRVLYVALTRAQDDLFLSSGGDVSGGYQQVESSAVSGFVEDMPSKLISRRPGKTQ